ncbi:MAG TPA: class I SAM-dependent methyltransferase [Clostridia bacterium]|nr:class I SAM-dependent methyltransferase [Clostridia bacterium]
MQENKYDDPAFFNKYGGMLRSTLGLRGAGEWAELKKMLPTFAGKRVLDLGCGYGWHCAYAAEHGAKRVTGIDISERMLAVARTKTVRENVQYARISIEDASFEEDSFDVVLSSLAFHYIEDFESLCRKVHRWLSREGCFVFSVEHPVFTAHGPQRWVDDAQGNHLYWPVDRYFEEGARQAVFLGERIAKYHRTLTSYMNGLLRSGMRITGLAEPQPSRKMLSRMPGMADELRRPMMLLISAVKTGE